MELRELRTFEAVARYGNLTRAAQWLGLTQPAVSGQIQALEREVGLRLVERLPRGVVLTEAGQALLDYARRLMATEAEASAVMGEFRGQQAALLRLGATPTVAAYVLPDVLRRFRQAHPEVRIVAQVLSTPHVVEALRLRAVDAGLVEAEPEGGDLVVTPFLEDELILVVPAAHPWAGRASIANANLAGAALVTREPGSGTRAMLDEALGQLGLRLRPVAELGTVEAIKNAVAAGLGVAFLSRLAVKWELQAGVLTEVAVEGLALRRRFYYLRHRYRYPTPLLSDFSSTVEDVGREAPPRSP